MEDVLFWTLCIASAAISFAMVAQAIAILSLYSASRGLLSAVGQLKVGSLRLSEALKTLNRSFHTQFALTSRDARKVADDAAQLVHKVRSTWDTLAISGQSFQDKIDLHSRRIARRRAG
jgi:hypothetical protein